MLFLQLPLAKATTSTAIKTRGNTAAQHNSTHSNYPSQKSNCCVCFLKGQYAAAHSNYPVRKQQQHCCASLGTLQKFNKKALALRVRACYVVCVSKSACVTQSVQNNAKHFTQTCYSNATYICVHNAA